MTWSSGNNLLEARQVRTKLGTQTNILNQLAELVPRSHFFSFAVANYVGFPVVGVAALEGKRWPHGRKVEAVGGSGAAAAHDALGGCKWVVGGGEIVFVGGQVLVVFIRDAMDVVHFALLPPPRGMRMCVGGCAGGKEGNERGWGV